MVVQRIVNLATVVFWTSTPLFGTVLIVPWVRVDWLESSLALLVAVSAGVLAWNTYAFPAAREGERLLYLVALFFVAFLFASSLIGG
jgi:hypothetical protein